MLRRAVLLAENLVQPWLVLGRLLWEAKGDCMEAEQALLQAFSAAWVYAGPHPEDAIKFPCDIEGVKPGIPPSYALGAAINKTTPMLDEAYSLLGVSLYPDAAKWTGAGGPNASACMPRVVSAAMRRVCAPPSPTAAFDSDGSKRSPFGVLLSNHSRPLYRWNTYLDPHSYQSSSIFSSSGQYEEQLEAWNGAVLGEHGQVDGAKGETQIEWGLGGVITGVQRMQVLGVVEEMARFWLHGRSDLFVAELLYRRALELCLVRVHT